MHSGLLVFTLMTVFMICPCSELFSVQEFALVGTSMNPAWILIDLKGVHPQERDSLYVHLEHTEIVVHMQVNFTV